MDFTRGTLGYCSRLFVELGADVSRVQSPQDVLGEGIRPHEEFCDAGKELLVLDTSAAEGQHRVRSLLEQTSVVVTNGGPSELRSRGLHPDDLRPSFPDLIHVSISPYGLSGPWADRPASDLTLLAAGGLLYLSGDPDRPPVRPYGEQSYVAASLHATTAAVMGLLVQETGGGGQLIDVSVQEAVAHSIENAAQYYDCEQIVRRRAGAGDAEAGTGLFACSDGWVYLLTSMGGTLLGWDKLATWLTDEQVADAERLREPIWADAEYRRSLDAKKIFASIFEKFTADKSKHWLYENGQPRGVSIAPVSTPGDLLLNKHLISRSFFSSVTLHGYEVLFPGPPFRFSRPHSEGATEPNLDDIRPSEEQ